MNVHQLSQVDHDASRSWDEFVLSHDDATFFHLSGWQEVIRKSFQHQCFFLFAEAEGKIVGILPLAYVKSIIFGKSLVSLPFAVYGGVVAADQSVAEALEKETLRIAERLKADRIEFRNTNRRHENWLFQDLYFTFQKRISCNSEENLKNIPRKQRAMIRKGMANELYSSLNFDTEKFYRLFANNMHRHGTPVFGRKYLDVLLEVFHTKCDILSIYDSSDRLISGVLNFYFKDQVLPYYAGDLPEARLLAANDFKYWELMRRSAERNIKLFDFGRSKYGTGSFSFKKNWGFQSKPLYYEYYLRRGTSIPQNNPANKKYYLAIELWKRLPSALVMRAGPHIVRNLG